MYQYPCIDIETENRIPVSFILCFKFHMHMKNYPIRTDNYVYLKFKS